jgi:hypothetical protein
LEQRVVRHISHRHCASPQNFDGSFVLVGIRQRIEGAKELLNRQRHCIAAAKNTLAKAYDEARTAAILAHYLLNLRASASICGPLPSSAN